MLKEDIEVSKGY